MIDLLCGLLPFSMQASPSRGSSANHGARHKSLKAWVACHELVLAIYRETRKWPNAEQYGLTSQARRSAYSAAANIAEGAAKRGTREFRRFLDISLGSLSELSYILQLGRELGYMKPEEWGQVEALRDHAGRLTWGLYRVIDRTAIRPERRSSSS